MKFLALIPWIAVAIASANPEPSAASADGQSRTWLGLKLCKPDATLVAQVPSLPQGVGFVVHSVEAESPAASAGIREFDILWKLNDQLLINQAQLATLLRLHNPGEEITLSGFRAGKPMQVCLKPGTAPVASPPFPPDLVDSVILPDSSGVPIRVVNRAEQTASYSTEDGSLEIQLVDASFHIQITSPDGKSIYHGKIDRNSDQSGIPRQWRRRVSALCRGLEHVIANPAPVLQPRPRVVPPSPKIAH
ncbi:MAG: PDZ domain-containing protein [Luteolibacter sp.]